MGPTARPEAAVFAAVAPHRLHCAPGRTELADLDSDGEPRLFETGDQHESAGGVWPAKRRLARALRALIDELFPTGAPEEAILEAAEWARQCAEHFATAPRAPDDPERSSGPQLGGMHDFHDRSPLRGLSNPIAPGIEIETDRDAGTARALLTFGNAYEGAPGIVHGGFVAAVLDELLGMVAAMSGTVAMTGEFTVRYRAPTPLNEPLRIEARLDRRSGRRIFTSAYMFAGDTRTADCTGLFIAVGNSKFEELERANLEKRSNTEPASRKTAYRVCTRNADEPS